MYEVFRPQEVIMGIAVPRIVLLSVIPVIWGTFAGFTWFLAWFATRWLGGVDGTPIGIFLFCGTCFCGALTMMVVEALMRESVAGERALAEANVEG